MDESHGASSTVVEDGKRTKRILVVDDSRTVLKILSGGLSSLGYEVITAEDGQEAIEILADVSFDLVLTDLNMPRVDGFELIAFVRSDPAYIDLPIIVLTSKGDKESMRRALDAGANIYLNKPAPLPKLRYKVQSLLGDIAGEIEIEESAGFASPIAQNAMRSGEREKRRLERMAQLSPEMHVEMYLMATNDEEAEELLADFAHRDDMDSNSLLPLMLDTSLSEDEMVRLYYLIASLKSVDFAVPMLHRFEDHTSPRVKAAMVYAIAECGHKEFLADLTELWKEEKQTTVINSPEQLILLQAFEDTCARLQGTETRFRSFQLPRKN